jgi:hypothetical protein
VPSIGRSAAATPRVRAARSLQVCVDIPFSSFQQPSTSSIAWAIASGAAWGRSCPVPLPMARCGRCTGSAGRRPGPRALTVRGQELGQRRQQLFGCLLSDEVA